MNYIISGALAALTQDQFPAFDRFHAHCEIHANLKQNCTYVLNRVNEFVQQNKDTAVPKGYYRLKEEKPNAFVWSTRMTANMYYTDDQIFEASNSENGGCKVHAKSQSESLSYEDSNVNFCNMYNVLHYVDTNLTYTTGDCTKNQTDHTACGRF